MIENVCCIVLFICLPASQGYFVVPWLDSFVVVLVISELEEVLAVVVIAVTRVLNKEVKGIINKKIINCAKTCTN